jgi:lipopolysaccharide assembly outer membrane protein LptD (OstA)
MKRLFTRKVFILVIFIFLTISFSVIAQEQEEMVVDEGNQKDESVVEITADQVNYDKENDQMIFIGNVVIIQEDTTLTAGQASFNVDTKIGEVSENVKLVEEDITIIGNTLQAYLNDKRYIFENNVELVQERENNDGEPDNVTWICQKLEIFTDTKDMTATGEVTISKQDYTITAQEAIYNDAEDRISLAEEVKIEEIENDRQISGDEAVFYIGDDRLEVSGNVRSSMILD